MLCFPRGEKFRLTAQVTRAVTSVAANIAEGNARGTRKDYAHFVSVARGSLAETGTFLLLAIRLGYVDSSQTAPVLTLVTEIGKMLTSLRSRLLDTT